MLFLLSPAKSLDFERPVPAGLPHTRPIYVDAAETLIGLLRERSRAEVAALMDLSDALAALNVDRYRAWRPRHDAHNARQAILAFDGDVYDGLDARTLSDEQLAWAQDHVLMLSGLYGVLRPLDRMQPYRLEMGTRLANARGKDLYAFWGATIAEYLNRRQAGGKAGDGPRVVVNLASEEYFHAVDRKALKARVVQCVFEEWRGDRYKIISFSAKRARGMMARFAIERQARTPDELRAFAAAGYRHDDAASGDDRLVFRRRADGGGERSARA
ncbi:MAG: peroxide stress protein YaaA [Burkholderiaceae bacterium]